MARGKRRELRTTQETHGHSTTTTFSEPPTEPFLLDLAPSLNFTNEDNVRRCVLENVSERLPSHVLNSLPHWCPTTLQQTRAFKGSTQNSTKCIDAVSEARHHQQAAENSDLISNLLQALAEAAPRPQHNSRCLLHVSYPETGQYPQKNDKDVLPPRSESPRITSFPLDPLSLTSPFHQKLLPSILAPANTGEAVSPVSALTARSEVSAEGISSIGDARTTPKDFCCASNNMKPPTVVYGENLVARSPHHASRLYNIWEPPLLLSSEDSLGVHLNVGATNSLPPPVEYDRNTKVAIASEELNFSKDSFRCGSTWNTRNNPDVDKMHALRNRQVLPTLEEAVVEVKSTTTRSPREFTIKNPEPLCQVPPLASSLPAEVNALPLENQNEKQESDKLGFCWDAIRANNQQSKRIEVPPADETEPQCSRAGKSLPAEASADSLISRKMCGANCNAAQVSAFITALHVFLASGCLHTDLGDHLNTGSAHHEFKKDHHDSPVASLAEKKLIPPETSPESNSQAAPKACVLGKDEKPETVVPGTKGDDDLLTPLGSTSDILGRPIYPSAACSDRTSCCSGITALGSDVSSYAGTNFDRSASYTSCSSFGTGGSCTVAPIMLDRSCTIEHAEAEKIETPPYSSFYQTSLPAPGTYVVDTTTAPREPARPAAMTTAPMVNDAARFQQLIKAFYADNSRHSILWTDRDGCLAEDALSGQGSLSTEGDTWKAAAGITEVTQQVNGLVNRLRGLKLITREMASIPDVSGEVVCCCLSGDLRPDGTNHKEAAASASTRWRFEQLLILSVKTTGSSKKLHGNDIEPSAVRSDEMSSASVAALYNFQIQDEVLVIAPLRKLQASFTQTSTHTVLESLTQRSAPDTQSVESSNSGAYSAASPLTHFQESISRHLLWRGLIALLKCHEQRCLPDGGAVTSSIPPIKDDPRSNCRSVAQAAPEPVFQWGCGGITASAENNVHNKTINGPGNDAEAILNDSTKGGTSVSFLAPQGEYHNTWKAGSGRPSEPWQHRTDPLRTGDATVSIYVPVRNETEREYKKPTIEALSGHADTATGEATYPDKRNTQQVRQHASREVGQDTNLSCQEAIQLFSKSRVQEYGAPLPGNQQLKQSATDCALENWSDPVKHLSTLPGSAALTEGKEGSSNPFVTALLGCLHHIDLTDDTSSRPKRERCFLETVNTWAKTTATYDTSRLHPSAAIQPERCKLHLDGPLRKLGPSFKWHDERSLQKKVYSCGTTNSRAPAKSSACGNHGVRKRCCGRQSLEDSRWRERAFRPLSPKTQAESAQENLEPDSDTVEDFQLMGFFREHCTVFISWVPRAARADNLKQKATMEMRLKVVLQMAMGVCGIVRVALFPPRGSHCCVLFENPAAASAFIQDYGGPTYTSTTEQFKADICAAYAVALDRGIERVFIRIEEFKPHILQQHLLQQTKDRDLPPLRPWQDRRRDGVPTSRQFTGGKWRQPQSVPARDRPQSSSATAVQSLGDSLSQHDTHTPRQTLNGAGSLPPWQIRDQSSEGCTRMPQVRPHAAQQLLEVLPHRNHRIHRRHK